MDTETLSIILTIILAVGGTYAALSRTMARQGERLARIEGIIEGWLNQTPPGKPPVQ